MELPQCYTNQNQLLLSSQIIGLLRDLMALLSSVTIVPQLTGTSVTPQQNNPVGRYYPPTLLSPSLGESLC